MRLTIALLVAVALGMGACGAGDDNTNSDEIFERETCDQVLDEAATYQAAGSAALAAGDDAKFESNLWIQSNLIAANDRCFPAETVQIAREHIAAGP